MVRPRRKPAPLPAIRLSRKRRSERSARSIGANAAQSDAQRLSAEIGSTVRSIRRMIDADAPIIQQDAASFRTARFGDDPDIDRRLEGGLALAMDWQPAASPEKPRSVLGRIWQAWGDRMLARLQPPPQAEPTPAPVIAPPPTPVPVPTSQEVAQIVLVHPDMHAQLKAVVQQELEGEMGAKFSANLRAVIRSQVAMAVQDQMIDA